MAAMHVCLHLAVSWLESRDHYTRSNELRGITGGNGKPECRNLACVFLISGVFLLFDHQEAFHCCLVVACVNKINMISI